jgi:hypothetical protein
MVVGYARVWVVLGEWSSLGREREQEKQFKIFFFLSSACTRKKENSAVQNGTISVFFFKKRKCNWEELKNEL